ncbi:uncharacterized protein LOC121055372 [Oryza brachyantha]|uniref:uncharacterized protein LOC121055372 n=1 Tax=Oryza brachyantha TaxID=4533 RepID=UPI001ADC9B8F|nr:uncharacterized protein LOC121055372 [Oryza brachyantha]
MAMGHLLHVKPFSSPPPPHSGDLKIVKIKHLLHAFVLKHGGRLAAVALGGAKALLLDIARGSVRLRNKIRRRTTTKKPWCGGGDGDGEMMAMHLKLLLPAAAVTRPSSETVAGGEKFDPELAYYDSSWNTMIPAERQLLRPISGYLSWPEKEEEEDNNDQGQREDDDDEEEDGQNEIDKLADNFIARCHERFMLEKQESYRRFHEMLARSL